MRLTSLVLVLACGALAGCKSAAAPSAFGVNLTIDARSLTQRAQVTSLGITTSGAEIYARTLSAASQLQGAGIVRTHYVPAVKSGSLVFTIDALDATGVILGLATTSSPVVLVDGKAVDVQLVLADVVTQPDGGMPIDMLPSTCGNGALDPDEVDVDCGGACAPCEPGKICKVAGDCATATCVSGHCELATGPPSWVAVTSLPEARAGASAATLDTGLYVAGGQRAFSPPPVLQTVLRYDMDMNAWVQVGPMTQPRAAFPLVAVMNQLFAPGGINTTDPTMPSSTATIEASNATASTWTQLARSLSATRAYHAAALGADKLLYIVGGMPYPAGGVLSTVESINPAAGGLGAATAQPALPTARAGLSASDDSLGRIVAMGGIIADNTVSGQVDLYDTAGKTWSSGPPLAVPRALLGTARGPDGRIYAVGGQNSMGGPLADVEALTANATHWTPIVSISPARGASAVATGWDGRIYAIGGSSGGTPVTTVEAYGPRVQPGPQMGAPGAVIALTCSNFAANAKVTVTFSGDAPGVVAASGTSNAQGSVSPSLPWHVPQVASGTYTLTAIDDRARFPVRATFVIP